MTNIGIEINGEFLDLNAAAVRLEKVNPFFIQDVYQGDFSFPFELPATEKNIRILKHVNSAEIINRVTEYTAWLYLYGAPHSKTKLTVNKTTRRSISAILNGGIKTLSTAALKLSEIDLGEDFNLGGTNTEIAAKAKLATETGDWQQYPFAFVPFSAPNFYGDTNPDFCGIVNRVNPTTGNIYTNDPLSSLNTYTLAPWLFLFYILQRIFKAENLNPSGSFWRDAEFSKLLLVNNRALDIRPRDKATLVRSVNEQLFNSTFQIVEFQKDGVGTYDNIEGWDESIDEYIIKTTGEHCVTVTLLVNGFNDAWRIRDKKIIGGYFYLLYDGSIITLPGGQVVFASIKNNWVGNKEMAYAVTLTHTFTAAGGDIGKALTVQFNASDQNGTPYAKVYAGSTFNVTIDANNKRPAPSSFLKYKDYVPDITVGELLVEVKKMGVMFDIDFNKSSVTLETVTTLLKEASVNDYTAKFAPDVLLNFEDKGKGILISYDYGNDENVFDTIDASKYIGEYLNTSDLPTPNREGDIAIITLTNEIYYTALEPTTLIYSWVKKGHYAPKYKIGKGESALQCNLAPVLMTFADNQGGSANQNKALMPYYPGQGSSDLFGLGINPCDLRFAFWRGLNNNGHATTPQGGLYVLASTGTLGKNFQTVGDYETALDKDACLIRLNTEKLYLAINEGVIAEADWYPDALDVYHLRSFMKMIINNDLWVTKNVSVAIGQRGTKAKAILLKL